MVCCDAKGFGGEEEDELLREPCMNGLLERFEGLVLLGLGPPAISSFVVTVLGRPCWEQRGAIEADRGGGGEVSSMAVTRSVRIAGEHSRGRVCGQRQPGCKTASKRRYCQVKF
jgi:hypothetical protein